MQLSQYFEIAYTVVSLFSLGMAMLVRCTKFGRSQRINNFGDSQTFPLVPSWGSYICGFGWNILTAIGWIVINLVHMLMVEFNSKHPCVSKSTPSYNMVRLTMDRI